MKPCTVKPGTKIEVILIIITFITRRNNPRVIRVMGRVKKIRTGLINRLQNVSTITTIIAVPKPSIDIPGRRYARSITESAEAIIFKIHVISFTCLKNSEKRPVTCDGEEFHVFLTSHFSLFTLHWSLIISYPVFHFK